MHIETQPRRRHGISLTPLIDVVFILLLFFMLATSFTDWRQIRLATGTTATANNQDNISIIVGVAPDGTLHYDGHDYTVDSLIPVLTRKNKSETLAAVVIHPAAETTLGPTVAALDALAATGLPVALSRPANENKTAAP